MGKQSTPEQNFKNPTRGEVLTYTYFLADSAAVPTETLINIGFGKNYFRWNVIRGVIFILCWVAAFPEHEAILTEFLTLWGMTVAFQAAVGHFNHFFGRREITTFVGYPLASFVFPIHFSRRVLNPLIVYGASCLVDDRALALLLQASAIGHVVVGGIMYAMWAADDDARSDGGLMPSTVERRAMNEHELPKEAVNHARHDMRNLRQGRSVDENVIRQVQGDLSPENIATALKPERGFLGRLADKIGQAWEDFRVGDEHAMGMVKLGFHELTQVLPAFPDSNIRPMEEPGVVGNEAMPHIRDDFEQSMNDNYRPRDNDRSHSH